MKVAEFVRMMDADTKIEVEEYREVVESFYDEFLGDLVEYRHQEVKYLHYSIGEYVRLFGNEEVLGFWAIAENVIGICLE